MRHSSIRGKSELLPRARIVTKLGAQVYFGGDRFKVGQGLLMTIDGKADWVFPLVPTSGVNSKSGEYFGGLRKSEIESMQMPGGFGGNLDVREVMETKPNDFE